jgi:hypothetical protein
MQVFEQSTNWGILTNQVTNIGTFFLFLAHIPFFCPKSIKNPQKKAFLG